MALVCSFEQRRAAWQSFDLYHVLEAQFETKDSPNKTIYVRERILSPWKMIPLPLSFRQLDVWEN